MRAWFLVACLAACGSDEPQYGVCSSDAECGGDVCARSGECVSASDIVPPMTVRWLINGEQANTARCGPHPLMHVVLIADDGAPDLTLTAPCTLGAGLVIDRIPTHLLWGVDVGPAEFADPESEPNDVGWNGRYVTIDEIDDVTLYLTWPN